MRHLRWSLLATGLALAPSAAAEPLPRFPDGAVWNLDISSAAAHPQSASMLSTLAGLCGGDYPGCGWGFGRMQIDFSIPVLHAAANAPRAAIVQHQAYDDYYLPDCDALGSTMPLPPGGAIEGGTGYSCDNENGDCHLLVVQDQVLYEAYSATQVPGGQIAALCLATWQLNVIYPPEGRGDHCTSADAAGFPIAALLFNADEIRAALARPNIADRHLGHAIRFILPNDRMASLPDGPDAGTQRDPLYVRPASHAGGPDGPQGSIPYGARLRLRANFPFTGYSPAAQVVLRTLQRYGMLLADGGGIALTAESDQFTVAKWSDPDIAIGSRVFDTTPGASAPQPTDFAVIDTGPIIPETYDCVRSVIPSGVLFVNGFE